MKNTIQKVKYDDVCRVLLTETLPYETPIIFSNQGFYQHIKKYYQNKSKIKDLIKYLFFDDNSAKYTVPIIYKIKKTESSFRHIGLLHPCSQVKFIEFYKDYSNLIINSCSKSNFSIRCPEKISSSFFKKNKLEDAKQFKGSSISNINDDTKFKHVTSYFSYHGYSKLHQFFNSFAFVMLERKYSAFWSLDISRCFDSIYTHSITWALKTKTHSKKTTSSKTTFGNIFDTLMQSSNFNETNGIIIGPETSRIFAEIIFQQIDCNIENDAKKAGYIYGVHYELKRYVDDMFIFGLSDKINEDLYQIIENRFHEYKLFLNKNKTKKTKHPFITPLSKAILETKVTLSNFTKRIIEPEVNKISKKTTFFPVKIWRKESVISNFINELKSTSIDNPEIYDVTNFYTLSAINNLIFEIINNRPSSEEISKRTTEYKNLFQVLIDIAHHLYSVSPSVGASIKLSIINLLSNSFFSTYIKEESNSIKLIIFEHSKYFLQSGWFNKLYESKNNQFLLEAINVLLSTRTLGPDFLLDHEIIKKVFKFKDNTKKFEHNSIINDPLSSQYFQITALLYYIGDEDTHNEIKNKILKSLNSIFKDLSDIRTNSEKCYLLLDILSCPFIRSVNKKKWVKILLKQWLQKEPDTPLINDWTEKLSLHTWFISWDHLELFNILERKELLKAY